MVLAVMIHHEIHFGVLNDEGLRRCESNAHEQNGYRILEFIVQVPFIAVLHRNRVHLLDENVLLHAADRQARLKISDLLRRVAIRNLLISKSECDPPRARDSAFLSFDSVLCPQPDPQ